MTISWHSGADIQRQKSATSVSDTGIAALPSVTVLLSTYNGETYLQAQLESLRAQKEVQVRLHARDDGSSDDTVAILHDYASVWPALAGVARGPNLRPASSFMDLLQTAPGDSDYYAFCDQDDVWLSHKLARATSALANDPGPALYCSNVTLVDANLRGLRNAAERDNLGFQYLLFENIAFGCTVVLNRAARELIASHPPAQGVRMHDWWCILVVGALGRVHYDREPAILYRQHGANTIGLDSSWIAQLAKHASRFWRERRAFYPIHAQAAELLRIHGSEMSQQDKAHLERLIASKRALWKRAAYALSGEIVHRRFFDALAIRGLVLLGWY